MSEALEQLQRQVADINRRLKVLEERAVQEQREIVNGRRDEPFVVRGEIVDIGG